MIHSKGSSTAAQSVWDFLKNIPSRLVGWFQGKFVTIATKIKCFFSGEGSRQSARQSDRTPLVERRVTSDSQKQDDSSLVKTSGSHVTTYGPPLPVLNGDVLRHICVEGLGSVTGKIKELMMDLRAETNLVIEACDKKSDSIELLRKQYDDGLFVKLAKKLDVEESIINDRDNYDVEQKIKLLKDILDKQRLKLSMRLKRIQYFYSELIEEAAEIRKFGADLSSRYGGCSPELASKWEVTELQGKLSCIVRMLDQFTKGKIGEQIESDAKLQTDLFNIQKRLQNLIQALQVVAPQYGGPR